MSEEKAKNKLNLKLIIRILSYSKPYKLLFFSALTLTLTLSSLAIVRPLLINQTLNKIGITNPNDANYLSASDKLSYLNTMGLFLIGILLLEAVLQFTNMYVTNVLGQNIVKDLRLQVYKHILKLKNSFFDKTPVGTLVTRAISDIESLSDVFSQGFIVIIGDMLMLVIFIIAMLLKNWVLALITLSTIPLLLIATTLFKNGIKKTFTDVRNAVASLNAFTNEHISGMRVVQLFNREQIEFEKFKEINEKHKVANIRSIWYYSVFFPVVEILSAMSIALFIWFAGLKANVYNIQLGDITFFIMMINMVFRPIRMLADRLNTLQMGVVASERVFKVLDNNDVIIENHSLQLLDEIQGKIEFKDVWFAYQNENYVLKNCTFQINPGETIAIIGATGAGKSSVISLINRFYEINKGEILIDDVPIQQFPLSQLRQSVGVVMQDVFLFNDTIINNITLHNSDITREYVIDAAKKIGIHEFISNMPDGYDYQVKERGASLSAGQRQLIAFVRAYVYNPSIFVLDEATASIDVNTELLIQKASAELAKNRTSIIIAHRLSTISSATRVIVMDKGEIIEMGTPQELSETVEGVYQKMMSLS
jgi:ATP-binding cassette subfamily B multidrug efflux pump